MQTSRTDEGERTKELAKRRVFLFFALFIVIALAGLIPEEADIFSHVVDEYALVGISIIALIYLAVSWKKNTLPELKMQHNILLVLFIMALIIQLYAIPIEISDPMDFGNDIPVLILLILLLANRFV